MTRQTPGPAAQQIAGATPKPPFRHEAGLRPTSVRFNGTRGAGLPVQAGSGQPPAGPEMCE
jgi:hypothetical protein